MEQRLAEAAAAQDAKWQARQAGLAAGKSFRGPAVVPAGQSAREARAAQRLDKARARLEAALQRAAAAPVKVNLTDPGSRVLPGKNGGYLQGWNLQLTAARNQILLAAGLHDNPVDVSALTVMIGTAIASCQLAGLAGQIRGWLADSGYASAANFQALDHLMLLVAVSKEATQTGRDGGDSTPGAVPAGWEKMAARLATPAGKRLYKRRAALVEPAFAQFFARFGRYLSYRGYEAADAEVKLLGAGCNLAKLLNHRRRQLATAP